MTKTEQNRVLAWRLKVLREASAAPRTDPHEPPRARSSPRFFICGSTITLGQEGSQTTCSAFTN